MSQAVFQVSVQNDPPTAPIPLLPLDGETLYTATPTLQWLDSLDPEGASLTYQVEVYSDKHLTTLVASVSGLPGTLLTTSWQVTPALLDKTTYYWRVRGSDGQLSSAWSGTQSFKVGKLTIRGTPRYFAVKPGGLNGRRVATIGSLGGLTGGETEAIFFYQTDHLGTPLMMTDQTGQVVWQAEYLPFGEPVSINEDVDGDGVNVTNNLRFPGQYYEQEIGLHYNLLRSYQPFVGRYLTPDPIGLLLDQRPSTNGINHPYGYAHQNPGNQIDPSGLYDRDVHYNVTLQLGKMVFGNDCKCPEVIARADQGMDANPDTGFPSLKHNAIWGYLWGACPFHFQTRDEVAPDIAQAATDCNFQRFGELLHAWQDTYAHAGFHCYSLGHSFSWTGPDQYIGSDKDHEMLRTTRLWLSTLQTHCQCECKQ